MQVEKEYTKVGLAGTATSNNLHVEHIGEIDKLPLKLRKIALPIAQYTEGGDRSSMSRPLPQKLTIMKYLNSGYNRNGK